LNYTANATENSTLIPLTYVWNYSNSSSEGAFDGWWTSNASRPVYVNVTKWKYDWAPLNYITYETNGIKKYGIEGYSLNSDSGIFKIVFNVPPNTQGKFNLTVTADGESFSLDPWWNSTWLYRRPITIDNTQNPNSLTDYQVAINLTYDSDMVSDFSDVRFTWYNSTSGTEIEIPYCLGRDCPIFPMAESSDISLATVNGQYTGVVVKVPYIPANGYSIIYVYYGNTTPVSSESNPKNVWDFYDDFNDNYFNTTEWATMTLVEDASIIETDGYLKIYKRIFPYPKKNFTYPIIIWENVMIDTDTYYVIAMTRHNGTMCANWASCYGIFNLRRQAGNAQEYKFNTPEALEQTLAFTSLQQSVGVWYRIVHRDGRGIYTNRYYMGSTLLYEVTNATIFGDYISPGAAHETDVSNLYVDNFTVRKFTDPEPTYSIGAEETVGPVFSVVFNYNSVDFGTVTPNTIAEAKSINYNVSITTNTDYKVSVNATDWSGPITIPANTLYFAVNDTLDKLSFSTAKQLSNAVQQVAVFLSSVTTNYHAFYFSVPLVPPGIYTTTVTITYEVA
jgi:hypothetical protein